jgi:hypothetical protein
MHWLGVDARAGTVPTIFIVITANAEGNCQRRNQQW